MPLQRTLVGVAPVLNLRKWRAIDRRRHYCRLLRRSRRLLDDCSPAGLLRRLRCDLKGRGEQFNELILLLLGEELLGRSLDLLGVLCVRSRELVLLGLDGHLLGEHLVNVGLFGLDALLVVPEVHVLGLEPLEPRRLPDALLRVQLLLAGEREVRVVGADLGGVTPACLQIVAHRRVLEEHIQREVHLLALVTEAALVVAAADVGSAHRLGVVRQLAQRHLKLSLKALVVGCGRACTIYLYDFLQSVLLCKYSVAILSSSARSKSDADSLISEHLDDDMYLQIFSTTQHVKKSPQTPATTPVVISFIYYFKTFCI